MINKENIFKKGGNESILIANLSKNNVKLELSKNDVKNCIRKWGGIKTFEIRYYDEDQNVLNLL